MRISDWSSDVCSSDLIGLVYCACAILFLLAGPRARLIIAAAILALYWPLALLPSLDGLATDIWVRGHNFIASVDRLLLGNHLYVKGPEGYDPEGILGTLPAIAQDRKSTRLNSSH